MFSGIFETFVNADAPCPEEIPFCNEWRAKYLEELQKAESGGCSVCKRTSIKARYLQIIHHKYMENLQDKNKQKK